MLEADPPLAENPKQIRILKYHTFLFLTFKIWSFPPKADLLFAGEFFSKFVFRASNLFLQGGFHP